MEKTGPWRDRGGGITPRPCIYDGRQTVVLPEGLLQCAFCKRTFQVQGFNYRILRKQ